MATNLERRARNRRLGAGPTGQANRFRSILIVLGLALIATGCGEDKPEVTMADRLADVEGRELAKDELNDRLALGNTLCRMDDAVLDAMWRQLNERQLNYQDVVFGHICPDRSVFYASLTGRYVTQDAVESGVVPSTTRPPLTTVAPSSTTTIASAPTTSEASVIDSERGPAPDDSSTASSATTPAETTSSTVATTTSTTAATTQPTISSVTTVEGEGG